ncbi:MAG TPA: hypothetical protein PKK43_10205 [Spirochaetota bacterium]|nr:hypothetical protein [Spirochaetota bacterium]
MTVRDRGSTGGNGARTRSTGKRRFPERTRCRCRFVQGKLFPEPVRLQGERGAGAEYQPLRELFPRARMRH